MNVGGTYINQKLTSHSAYQKDVIQLEMSMVYDVFIGHEMKIK
jgi:hypothetical protein